MSREWFEYKYLNADQLENWIDNRQHELTAAVNECPKNASGALVQLRIDAERQLLGKLYDLLSGEEQTLKEVLEWHEVWDECYDPDGMPKKHPRLSVLNPRSTDSVGPFGPQGNSFPRPGGGEGGAGPWVSPFSAHPLKSTWESNMVVKGAVHAAFIANTGNTFDSRLAAHYYDATWVYYSIRDYTNDPIWDARAASANAVYAQYIADAGGAASGPRTFPRGFEERIRRLNDSVSRSRLEQMNENAPYTRDSENAGGLAYLLSQIGSRENAYALNTKLTMISLGYSPSPRLAQLVDNCLSHLDQWFGPSPGPYAIRPFMWSLTCRSLIRYVEFYSDARVLPAILSSARKVWSDFYLVADKAFKYTNIDTALLPTNDPYYNTGGTEATPDLNLLIIPVFAWLYNRTGDRAWIHRGDLAFEGGVLGAFVDGSKQFNESYTWSFDYVKLREERPVTGTSYVDTKQISGTITESAVGVDAVTITASEGATNSVSTNVSGLYSIGVPNGRVVTLTPTKSGKAFSPPSRRHAVSDADIAAQNFTVITVVNYDPANFFTGGSRGFWLAVDQVANNRNASSTQALNGERVATVNDSGAGGFNLTQATDASRPTLVTGALNGLPVLTFDGARQFGNTSFDSFLNSASSVTFGVVFKPTVSGTSQQFFRQYDSTFAQIRFMCRLNGLTPELNYNPNVANNSNTQSGGTVAVNGWHAALFQVDAANRTVAIYANNATALAPVVVTGPAQNFSGAPGGAGSEFFRFIEGQIAYAFAHKNAIMTTQQRSDWFASVKNKYALLTY